MLARLEVEFAPLAREKGLALEFMPCSLAVRSDRRLLRRLLQNLVSNAIKYTQTGRVLVGCRRRGAHLRIDVYDTGIGIPHAKRRAVFKEFHRLDQGARVARGVGLGLSIVERIGRVLDCEVTLKSAVGHGSRFSVEVPRAVTPIGRPALHPAAKVAPGKLAGTCVLCIDNEPSILTGMETLLGGWGCRVITALDLTGALAAVEARGAEPDGLLVDYHLDGGDGLAAIAELRRRFRAELPAILDHRRPLGRRPRKSPRRRRASSQQADQARIAAGAGDPMAGAAGGGGVSVAARLVVLLPIRAPMCIFAAPYTHWILAMRTNIEIDELLLAEAMAASGCSTKKATVEEALRRLVERHRQKKAIEALAGAG